MKNNNVRKRILGVSYTNRDGKRIHVYRDEFPTIESFIDKAENIILYAKNPRKLKSYRKIKDFYPRAAKEAKKGRKARR